MRNSTLLKWAQNSNNKQIGKTGNRNWIHPPDALQRGHIAYLVKFLGDTEVDQPKGIEVVKEGIRKLQFNQRLRKAEGTKTPKVELTISIDGVAIQEPKTKRIMHQYPLHRISYCADDKGEKRFFSFIAKDADSERHVCFVFVSDKLAEEITLTIGQAFDLAYRRFLESSGKDLEVQRRIVLLQQRAKQLEAENLGLRQRLQAVASIKGQEDVEDWMAANGVRDLLEVTLPSDNSSTESSNSSDNGNHKENGNLLNLMYTYMSSSSTSSGPPGGPPPTPLSFQPPPVPPRTFEASRRAFADEDLLRDVLPTVGTKLEGLLLEEEDFNPRATTELGSGSNPFPSSNGTSSSPPLLAPPPKVLRRPQTNGSSPTHDPFQQDLFGSEPFNPAGPVLTRPGQGAGSALGGGDPFGMEDFGGRARESEQELENALGFLDKKLLEMKDGFSRGLTFGNDDFSLESLDPLRN